MNKINKRKPKILVWDIENTPNRGYFFEMQTKGFNQVPMPFVERTHSIISIAYKFFGEKEKGVISIADFPKTLHKDPYDDKEVIKKFVTEIMPQADFMVAHYGDKHDTRMLAARCLLNNLIPPPEVPTVDTYKLVKKHFKLNTNKLDHLGFWLGEGVKHPMNAQDWVDCAKGNVKAIKKMASYNLQDVLLLEKVFTRLLPYVDHKISFGLYKGTTCCNACQSLDICFRGTYATKAALKPRYQCNDCGKWGHLTKKADETENVGGSLGKWATKILGEYKGRGLNI